MQMAQTTATDTGTAKATIGTIRWLVQMGRALPGTIFPVLGFSLVVNVLMLVSPLYMLQVYDRILTSGSSDTLIWLTVIAVFLMGVYAAAETGRRRLCAVAAERIDTELSERVFEHFQSAPDGGQRLTNDLRVLGRVRAFFANQSVLPFFDLPFAPLFLIVMFMIHPLIGTLGLLGAAILLAVAVTAELTNRNTQEKSAAAEAQAFALATGLSRQRSAIIAMGLSAPALARWRAAKIRARDLSLKATSHEGAFSAVTRSSRQTLQILILGAGGALAITQQVSPGAIVAGSIILSRALGPIDQIVGSWRGVASARQAWAQLAPIMAGEASANDFTPLPRPAPVLTLDRLAMAHPGGAGFLLRPFSTELPGGQMVALIGPNGSGKSSLLQVLSGAWAPSSGMAALGGRDIHGWAHADRGPHVGYLPQDTELLPGTVGQNIARMTEAEPEAIIAAAKAANAHDMILALPDGYETPVGTPGVGGLSAGQRQLIGLARALFGQPVLLLLDEPTANLDPATAYRTISALNRFAKAGGLVVVSSHDIKLIQATQRVLVLDGGTVVAAPTRDYLAASRPKTRPEATARPKPRLQAVGD